MSRFVLDASGLLAYLQDEEGAAEVSEALAVGATIGAANLAEALSKLAGRGEEPSAVLTELVDRGVLAGLLEVEPLTLDDALVIAELRRPTIRHGLGLGDRACLALGKRLALPVLTADRVWRELEPDLGVEVRALRS